LTVGVESPDAPKRGGYQGQAPKRGGGGGKVEPTSSHIHHNPQSKAAPPEDDDKEDSEGHDDTHQSGIHSSSGPSNNNYYDYNSQYSHGGHQAGYSYTNPSGGSYNYGMQGHPHPGSQNYGGMYNYGPGGMSRHPAKPNYPAYGSANYDYNSRQGYGPQNPMHMKTGNSHMVHNQYYQEHDYSEEAQVSPGARAPVDGPGYGNMKGADYNRNDRSQKAPGQGMQYPHQYGGHMSQQMYGGAGAGQHSGSEQSGSYDYTSAYKQPPSKPGPELGAPGGMGYNYRQPQMPIPSYNPGVNNDSDSGKPHGGPGASKIPGGAKQGSGNPAKK